MLVEGAPLLFIHGGGGGGGRAVRVCSLNPENQNIYNCIIIMESCFKTRDFIK